MYRDIESNDVRFIKSSILRSWKDNPRNRGLSADKFLDIIDNLLATSEVKVICSDEDFDCIYGFAIFKRVSSDTVVLHAVLIKKIFQRLGMFSNFVDILKKNGVKNVIITLNLKNTSNVIPYLARNFKLDDRR